MTKQLRQLFLVFSLLTAGICQAGPLDSISSNEASGGVREALSTGAEFAVGSLGKDGGFLHNDKVRIPLPGYLEKAEKGLRMFGMGKQADELKDAMNHAAELAVAEALPILKDSIKKMTLSDAKAILTGGDDSVTEYFRRTSSKPLAAKFKPIVAKATDKVSLADKYDRFAGKAASAGLIDKKDADLDSYVTNKAMDGLFLVIAEKEKELRSNPLGASSGLLKKVFGAL